jgi:hypothetical protein
MKTALKKILVKIFSNTLRKNPTKLKTEKLIKTTKQTNKQENIFLSTNLLHGRYIFVVLPALFFAERSRGF